MALKIGTLREELIALKWNDIDFKNHTIFIMQALIYTKTNCNKFKFTKNKKRRLVEVTEEVLQMLRAEARQHVPFKIRPGDKYTKENKLVFCREDAPPDSISS